MQVGQIIKAKNDFELYGLVKSSITIADFHSEHYQIFHFSKISETEYLVDAFFEGEDYSENKSFLSQFSEEDIFCALDSTDNRDHFSFGSKALFASVIFTDLFSWTENYQDHLGNPEFNEYMNKEAREGFSPPKKLAS